MPRAVIDLTGKRFGRLIAIRHVEFWGRAAVWLCKCDCGRAKKIRSSFLRRGVTRSCGCLMKEASEQRARHQFTKHGHTAQNSVTREYRSWNSMTVRCTNPKAKEFSRYGGAGIKICKRWGSFKNFLADMGPRPIGKTLDRYPNPYGDYKPSNCRWATLSEQQHNRRTTRK
jgi:hypothetical protein